MRRYLIFFALDMGFPDQEARLIGASFFEVVRNVIQHAYLNSKKSIITVEFQNFKTHIKVYIKDFGRKVSRSEILGRPIDEYRTYGLGLYLIENVMDYIHYDTSPKYGTILTMVKQLGQ